MTKLTREQKTFRKTAKENLENRGGEIFSFADEGVTVAVAPATGGYCNFAHVAVAQCSLTDTFKRKTGELVALERLTSGQVISVPFNYRCNEDIAEAVRDMMTALV
jgi:hypothetical protein